MTLNTFLKIIVVIYQLWVYTIICGSIFTVEILTITMSSSIAHILENLSYRAGVVMTRWTCDESPITDLIHTEKKEVQSVMSGMNLNFDLTKKDPLNADKIVSKSVKELESDLVFTKSEMSRVVKNLVDIEYGLEGYLYFVFERDFHKSLLFILIIVINLILSDTIALKV